MTGVLVLFALLVATGAVGVWLQRSGHRLAEATSAQADPVILGPGDLGADLGERATLVQFSSAFCSTCRGTRAILARVSGQVEGVAHVEIDAESNLDLVRRLDVMRTPTVLVLDSRGRIVRRASGQPRYADVVAAVGAAVES